MAKRQTKTKTEPVAKVIQKEQAPQEKVVVTSGAPIPLDKASLVAYIEKLKAKNPAKYQAKKAELEAKLANIS